MYRHLVTVKIRIKRRTYQRMKLNRLTLYQNRLKRLYTQSMQGRRTVQHYRMLLNNFLQNIPYFRLKTLYHLLRTLNIMRRTIIYQLFHNKRLK